MQDKPPQPTETVESILQETRKYLYSAANSAENISEKIHGPRPSDSSCEAQGPEFLFSLADDCRRLARRVVNELAEHHNAIGFERNKAQAMATGNSLR